MVPPWLRSTSNFIYEALSQDQIRLVTINPGSISQKIICSIQNVNLCEGMPQYSAISYTWGSSTNSKFITCAERRQMVTKNLEVAMRYIRHTAEPITVWIDQLCINQEDKVERESQVKIMGSIFRHARDVIVWLGEEADNSSRALELAQKAATLDISSNIWTDDAEAQAPANLSPDQQLPKWEHPDWQIFGALLRRPWFERVWVIQEVAVSSKTTVKCGNSSISWDSLAAVVKAIDFQTRRPVAASNTIQGSSAQRVRFINDFKISQRQSTASMDLFQFLILAKSCKATDPRDKIFAFLDLADFGIVPSYGKDLNAGTAQLYVNFAISYITKALGEDITDQLGQQVRARKVMSIIYSAGSVNQKLHLPSWVPDWSIEFQAKPLWPGKSWSTVQANDFSAGGHDFGHHMPEIVAGRHLRLLGKRLDFVKYAGSVKLEREQNLTSKELYTSASKWYQEAKYINVLRGETHPEMGREDEVFKRTLSADRGLIGDLCSMDHIRRTHESWGWLINNPRHIIFKSNLDRKKHDSTARWLYHGVTVAAHGRVFMLTRKGAVGLVPLGCQPGDEIWILLGGNMPVIVRPLDTGFTLIGECYVHGIMNGEILRDGRIPVEDITLL